MVTKFVAYVEQTLPDGREVQIVGYVPVIEDRIEHIGGLHWAYYSDLVQATGIRGWYDGSMQKEEG